MLIDERLRTGLAANTAHLQPNLDAEFGALLGRAHPRRRARQTSFGLTAAAAAIGGLLWLIGPLDTTRGPAAPAAPAGPAPSPSATFAAPTPLERMSGPLLPSGEYVARFRNSGAAMRAVIEVPDGFTTDGTDLFDKFPTVGSDWFPEYDGTVTGSRAIGFGTVAKVRTHPCYGSDYMDPGPTVEDLALALARQPLRGRTGDPVPVSLGGYDGLYLELSVPADLDVTDCIGGQFERWRPVKSDPRWRRTPGKVDRVWILDVEGDRMVVNAVHTPRAKRTDVEELTRIVESITFTSADPGDFRPAPSSCEEEKSGDSTGAPDLTSLYMDRLSLPNIYVSWRGRLPATGTVDLRFLASSADRQRSRVLGVRIVDRKVTELFVEDLQSGDVMTVPHNDRADDGLGERLVDLSDDGLRASFPEGTLAPLGNRWTWTFAITVDGGVVDSC